MIRDGQLWLEGKDLQLEVTSMIGGEISLDEGEAHLIQGEKLPIGGDRHHFGGGILLIGVGHHQLEFLPPGDSF